jgi:hypothetical protein
MAQQALFEPLDRWNIEMIGGLVEQENLRIADQHLRQANATALATR